MSHVLDLLYNFEVRLSARWYAEEQQKLTVLKQHNGVTEAELAAHLQLGSLDLVNESLQLQERALSEEKAREALFASLSSLHPSVPEAGWTIVSCNVDVNEDDFLAEDGDDDFSFDDE
jgi:hypothetical protein